MNLPVEHRLVRGVRLGNAATPAALAILAASTVGLPASADDLTWVNLTGVPAPFYDAAGNWNPAQVPTVADNVFFNADATYSLFLTGNLAGGSTTSRANNVTVSAGNVTFAGGGGAFLDSEGLAVIDAAAATSLGAGPTLTLSNVGWLNDAGEMHVGNSGAGSLMLNPGAVVRHAGMRIGNQAGSFGMVSLDDATIGDSVTFNFLQVGHLGHGTLHADNGSVIYASEALFGVQASSSATVTLDNGAVLNGAAVDQRIVVGRTGSATLSMFNSSSIFKGGAASGSRDLIFGEDAGATVGALVDDSNIDIADDIVIGGSGVADVTLRNGARMAAGDTLVIGGDAVAGASGALLATDSGTQVYADRLFVGDQTSGTMTLQTGAQAFTLGDVYVGNAADNVSTASKLTVFGAGSRLDAAETTSLGSAIFVGNATTGAMDVMAGGYAESDLLRVGQGATGDGTLRISGAGSSVNVTGAGSNVIATVIGTAGQGELIVENGGSFTSPGIWFGFGGAGEATVDINNGTVTSGGGDLHIGGRIDQANAGGTADVVVRNGGQLFAAQHTYIGGNAAADGELTITGAGSLFDNDDNAVGVTANDITRIGRGGRGVLTVENGGRMIAEGIVVGDTAGGGSNEARLTLRGVDTSLADPVTLEVRGFLYVGHQSQGQMTVEDGAIVRVATNVGTERLIVGDGAAADGAQLTVTGAGSLLDYQGTADVSIGNNGGITAAGGRSRLVVSDGGTFSADTARMVIGDQIGSHGRVQVMDPGSSVTVTTALIGDGTSNSTGRLEVSAGGRFTATASVEAGSAGAGTGFITVTGPGSILDVGTTLSLGDDIPSDGPANGFLNILDGGTVNTGGSAYIGHYTGTLGDAQVRSATADVSTWNVGDELTLAGTEDSPSLSGSGDLTVDTGGEVNVVNLLRIRDRGVVRLRGGKLSVGDIAFLDTAIASGSPTFDFQSGTLEFDNAGGAAYALNASLLQNILGPAPTLQAGQTLAVTGTADLNGSLRLNGGTFRVGAISSADAANLDWDAGTFALTGGNLIVSTSGLFGANLTLDNDQTLVVDNTLTVAPGGNLNVVGGLRTGQTINQGEATFISGSGTKIVVGTYQAAAGSATNVVGDVQFDDLVTGPGNFFGSGNASFAGGYQPGSSPGVIAFEGDVTFAASNDLEIELFGDAPGDFDRLEILGDLTAGGTLSVVDGGGFVPLPNDVFEIFTYAGFSGSFDLVNATAFAGLTFDLSVGGDAALLLADALFDGDANLDGRVSLADFLILRANFGQGDKTWLEADFNGDGLVSLADFLILRGNFGSGIAGNPGPAPTQSMIPEPASPALLALLATPLLARRRRD